jgi:hypothetical protein
MPPRKRGFSQGRYSYVKWIIVLCISLLVIFSTCVINGPGRDVEFVTPEGNIQVSFSVASDMRKYSGSNPAYFRGACETLAAGGPGEFMVSPGDIDPPNQVYDTIRTYIGDHYTWYPVVGNHEAASSMFMEWLRVFNRDGYTLPNIVNAGPSGCEETTYSFDYGDAHFLVLNEYYDGKSDCASDGDVQDALYNWLIADLETNTRPIVFVFGHEPAYPQPDQESGRLRHETDSLNAHPAHRDRFWNELVAYGVVAYICGHTHNYSVVNVDGLWQIDAGHARGTGDTGARSTFLMLYVTEEGGVFYYTYRLDFVTEEYFLADSGQLR